MKQSLYTKYQCLHCWKVDGPSAYILQKNKCDKVLILE